MQKIEQKIVGYKVLKPDESPPVTVEQIHEGLSRPELLKGTTYKIKTPQSEHALYITINDYELNGVQYPYEIFINSKNMEHFQWVLAITRLISAIWRKGGNSTFLIEELKAVFDPKGGYFKRVGGLCRLIVAEIGYVIEQHLGIKPVVNQSAIDAKKELISESGEYPENATVCAKCSVKAVIVMDGCATCLSCGDSKCG